MSFALPDLPYAATALEPHIDARTMEIHHGKHHAMYISNLNKALESAPQLAGKDIEELLANSCVTVPESIRTAARNNGGGHSNHSLFWEISSGDGGGKPVGKPAAASETAFGSFEEFKSQFTAAAVGRLGSGLAWLTRSGSGRLEVFSSANQDSPLMDGKFPILGLESGKRTDTLQSPFSRVLLVSWWSEGNKGHRVGTLQTFIPFERSNK